MDTFTAFWRSALALGSKVRGDADVTARLAELDLYADTLRGELQRVQNERATLAMKAGLDQPPAGVAGAARRE